MCPIGKCGELGGPKTNFEEFWLIVADSTLTLDLSEFNVNVMTGNNGAHQRSPYDPRIQKQPFFFDQTTEFFLPLWTS